MYERVILDINADSEISLQDLHFKCRINENEIEINLYIGEALLSLMHYETVGIRNREILNNLVTKEAEYNLIAILKLISK